MYYINFRTECTRRSTPPTNNNYSLYLESHSPPDFMLMPSSYPTNVQQHPSVLSSQQYNSAANYHHIHHHTQHPHHNYHLNPTTTASHSHHLSFFSPPRHFTQFRPMLGLSTTNAVSDELPAGLTAFCKFMFFCFKILQLYKN